MANLNQRLVRLEHLEKAAAPVGGPKLTLDDFYAAVADGSGLDPLAQFYAAIPHQGSAS